MEAKTYRQVIGRYKFLEAVKAKNSNVLETLRAEVLPIFKIAMKRPRSAPVKALNRLKSLRAALPTDVIVSEDNHMTIATGKILQLATILFEVEAMAEDPDAGDLELSHICRMIAGLKAIILTRTQAERWALFEQATNILAARGATELTVSVGGDDEVPIPIRPHPGVTWPEIESSPRRKFANARAAILQWAQRYNLTDAWILETVVQTLISWMLYPDCEEDLRWAHAGHLSPIPKGPPLFQGKPRLFESAKEFENRIKDELRAFRSTHIEYFSAIGSEKERFHKHAFEWLALYQTKVDTSSKPYSPGRIASEFLLETGKSRTASAIILAMHAAAEGIGLTLRENLRGMRRKQS